METSVISLAIAMLLVLSMVMFRDRGGTTLHYLDSMTDEERSDYLSWRYLLFDKELKEARRQLYLCPEITYLSPKEKKELMREFHKAWILAKRENRPLPRFKEFAKTHNLPV